MELAPRHLKSILTCVANAAWLLGRNPTLKIIVTGYFGELADNFSRDLRLMMKSA